MASAAQITANRANAQLCTGPKTEAGKQRSSQNALNHGLFSSRLILPDEKQEDFDALLAEMMEAWKPVGAMEEIFVREMTENYWKLRRGKRMKHELLCTRVKSTSDVIDWMISDDYYQLERMDRAVYRLDSAWHRSLDKLYKAQAVRRREEESASREAERQARREAAEARRQSAESRRAAADARRAAAESRRKSEQMLQEILMPSDYSEEIGFVLQGGSDFAQSVEFPSAAAAC